jgi:hypothetical protein
MMRCKLGQLHMIPFCTSTRVKLSSHNAIMSVLCNNLHERGHTREYCMPRSMTQDTNPLTYRQSELWPQRRNNISFGTENNDERYLIQQEEYLSFIVSRQKEIIWIASLLQHEQWLWTAVAADRTKQLWLHSKSLDKTRCSGRPTGCFGISLPSLGATKNVSIFLMY